MALAVRLPNRNKDIVDKVADVAFSPYPVESEIFEHQDIRPFARAVLATFGAAAERYGQTAYTQISIDDPLGTGAAQIAAATRVPGTLARVQRLMTDKLSSLPPGQPIPGNITLRMLELTLALTYGGDEAKSYVQPLHTIMERKIGSHAPPFGTLALDPYEFCPLLARIEGREAALHYSFCNEPGLEFPFEPG